MRILCIIPHYYTFQWIRSTFNVVPLVIFFFATRLFILSLHEAVVTDVVLSVLLSLGVEECLPDPPHILADAANLTVPRLLRLFCIGQASWRALLTSCLGYDIKVCHDVDWL